MMRQSLASLVVLLCLCHFSPAGAQLCGETPDMLILLDQSASMNSSNKWTDATSAVSNLTSNFSGKIRFGLLMFPWPWSASCSVQNPQVNVGDYTQTAIMAALPATAGGSYTPIGMALQQAHTYLTAIDPTKDKYVMLVTDGQENCSVNGVTWATNLLAAGIKTYVVGFGSGVNASQLSALAQAGGTPLAGTPSYYQADNLTQLNSAFSTIAGQVSCCGNGVLDQGEQCDTAIAAGKAGACPTSCNDGNACTTDTLTGSQCLTQCTYTAITTAKNNDGCCPPGATSLTDNDCKVVCGNGLLEAGETCDPAITSGSGLCPTAASCNDGNVCTADSVTGTACQVKCLNTALTASLSAKDGCCPVGATSLTDLDCPAGCGNGLLETGETCDPKITSGTGKCPTLAECDDKDACTTDTLGGGACNLKCLHAAVGPDSTKKDGCCPKSANSVTDKDCPAKCGNGVLETGETCDTGISSGPGKCKTLSDCNDGNVCTTDALAGTGCNVSCTNTPLKPDATKKDGCCPSGQTSQTDADCQPPCGPDKTTGCIDLCKGVTCPSGHYCSYGKCVPWGKKGDGGTPYPADAGPGIKTEAGTFVPGKRTEAGTFVPGKHTEAGFTPGRNREAGGFVPGVHTEAGFIPGAWTDGGAFSPGIFTEAGFQPGNPNLMGKEFLGEQGCDCSTGASLGAGITTLLVLSVLGLFALITRRRRR